MTDGRHTQLTVIKTAWKSLVNMASRQDETRETFVYGLITTTDKRCAW